MVNFGCFSMLIIVLLFLLLFTLFRNIFMMRLMGYLSVLELITFLSLKYGDLMIISSMPLIDFILIIEICFISENISNALNLILVGLRSGITQFIDGSGQCISCWWKFNSVQISFIFEDIVCMIKANALSSQLPALLLPSPLLPSPI